MGVAVGILLLSGIRAEIYVNFCPLPVSGRQLCFMTYPDIGQYSQYLSVLLDHVNMGVAVGISLLSCLRTELYVISYPLLVNGRHVCFTTYPDIEQHHYFLLYVLWHWKKRFIICEIVLLSCILAHIRVITKFQPPSCISDFRFHLGVLLTSPLKIVTPKTWG